MTLAVKVCGITSPADARMVVSCAEVLGESEATKESLPFRLAIGGILYDKSPRYVNLEVFRDIRAAIPETVPLFGVVVNESLDFIREVLEISQGVQLHGDESPEFVAEVARQYPDAVVWKAVAAHGSDLGVIADRYAKGASAVLFDTPTSGRGGSGRKFDWELLDGYAGDLPFILSGGIGPDDISEISGLSWPKLLGVDVNSCLESSPGVKDRDKLQKLFHILKDVYNL